MCAALLIWARAGGNLAPLDGALTRLQTSAAAYDGAYTRLTSGQITLSASQRAKLNALLQGCDGIDQATALLSGRR